MANSWLRLWHDMPNDPKWRTIARVSGQSVALVQAVYLQLLVSASQNPVTDVTGVTLHVTAVTNEDIASSLDVTEADVASVTKAMQGRVLDGDLISGWDKRQALSYNTRNPGKPAQTGAERVRAHRERKRMEREIHGDVTTGNVTEGNGNGVTPQIRIDKKRIDKELKDKTHLSVAEKNQPPTESEFIRLPLNDGSEFIVTQPMIAEWESLYPAVDIRQELRNQRGWLLAEPRRRKTRRGVNKFINTWLQKRQDNPTAASRQVNHAKTTANANGNSGESRAMQKFHAAARERLGDNFMEILGNDDRNILRPVDSEERGRTIIPLGDDDWETV